MQETEFCSILESTSKHLEPEASSVMIKGKLAQVQELLVKKKDSLLGLQRLCSALLETQQEMSGVKECIGEPWFRPWWERFALLKNRGKITLISNHSCNESPWALLPLQEVASTHIHS